MAHHILNIVKMLWLLFWASMATILVIIPISLSSLFSSTGHFAFNMTRLWAFIILTVSRVKVELVGQENINRNTSYIIVSNHQSLYDAPSLAYALGIQFRWIIKKELYKIPLFGHGLSLGGNIFIDRSNRETAMSSILEGVKRLPSGVGLLFFPEGTRSPYGSLQKFKKGAFAVAIKKKLPILPITILGSGRIMPTGSVHFTPGTIQLIVHAPVSTENLTDKDLEMLTTTVEESIASLFKTNTQ